MSNGHRNETLVAADGKDGKVLAYQNSPFPPTVVIDTFEKHNPGSAERILKMAEADQTHRHNVERLMCEAEQRRCDRMTKIPVLGMWFGFLLCAGCLGVGAFLLYVGKDIGGYSSMFAALCVLVGNVVAQAKK